MYYSKSVLESKADSWVKYVSSKYNREICNTLSMQKIYDEDCVNYKEYIIPDIKLIDKDTVSALFDCAGNDKVCVLNFASFKNPGGGFLRGAMAQEEALCHVSTLYPCIESASDYYYYNNRNLNKGLYLNRAIYSPNIVFEYDGRIRSADVITCASPNNFRWSKVSKDDMKDAVNSRVRFMYSVVADRCIDVLIVGAWGCGVFHQDPHVVSKAFIIHAKHSGVKKIIMAVPERNSVNYKAFDTSMDSYCSVYS